jgi:hypothetical protein
MLEPAGYRSTYFHTPMAFEIRSLSNRKANVVPKLSILSQPIDLIDIYVHCRC